MSEIFEAPKFYKTIKKRILRKFYQVMYEVN